MAECTSEGGKLWLAEAIFSRYKYSIPCATCIADVRGDRQGFVKDSAGNKTKSGLRHRYWRCQRSQSSSETGSRCPKLTTTAFLQRARVFLSREQYMRAARDAIAFSNDKGEDESIWLRSALELASYQSDAEYRAGKQPLRSPMSSSSPRDEMSTTPPSTLRDELEVRSDDTSFQTSIDGRLIDMVSSSPLPPFGRPGAAKRKLEAERVTAEELPKRLRVVSPGPDPMHGLSARLVAVEEKVIRLEGEVVRLKARLVQLTMPSKVEVGPTTRDSTMSETVKVVEPYKRPDVSPLALAKSFLSTTDPVERRRIRAMVLNHDVNVEFQDELARAKASTG